MNCTTVVLQAGWTGQEAVTCQPCQPCCLFDEELKYLTGRGCKHRRIVTGRQGSWPEPVTVHAVGDDDGAAAKLLGQDGLHSFRDCSHSHWQMHDHVEQLILLLVVMLDLQTMAAVALVTACALMDSSTIPSSCMTEQHAQSAEGWYQCQHTADQYDQMLSSCRVSTELASCSKLDLYIIQATLIPQVFQS